MTDARLHSTKPIDDEVPFADAIDVPGEEAPADEDALVTPAAAERERTMPTATWSSRGVRPTISPKTSATPDRGQRRPPGPLRPRGRTDPSVAGSQVTSGSARNHVRWRFANATLRRASSSIAWSRVMVASATAHASW